MDTEEAIRILKKFRLSDVAELDNAIPMALTALDKQIPMKIRPLRSGLYRCPVCDNFIHDDQNFCPYCGQALDWSEVEK